MATLRYIGTAPKIAQVQSYTFAGTWEATDVVIATIGTVSVPFVAGSTVIATIIDAIVAAWEALEAGSYPQFRELTPTRSGDILIITGRTSGRPFVVTLSTTEDGGGAADAQTIEGAATPTTGTLATSASSPNHWSIADNWDSDTVPAAGDVVVLENSAIDILYGLEQSAVDLERLVIRQSFTGKLGLPKRNGNYEEYLPDYLEIGLETGVAGLDLGSGEGSGSGRLKIKVNADAFQGVIHNSGTPAENGIPAVLLQGGDGASLTVLKGSVGVAVFAGETANLSGGLKLGYATNQATDANVRCGSGVTLDGIEKNGGILEIKSSCGEFVHEAGESIIQAGAPSQLTIRGGRVVYNSITTLAGNTIVGDGATLDFNLDPRAKVVTNPFEIFGRGRVLDDFKVVNAAGSFVLDLNEIGRDYPLNIGSNIRITRQLLSGGAPAGTLTRFAANVGDGVEVGYAVAHNLGTRDVLVEVYRNSTPWDTVLVDVERTDANTVTLTFGVIPTTDQYRVVVIG